MKISTAERGRERIAVMGAQRMAHMHIMGVGERGAENSATGPKPPVNDRPTVWWQC
jgi:hypothetical protein